MPSHNKWMTTATTHSIAITVSTGKTVAESESSVTGSSATGIGPSADVLLFFRLVRRFLRCLGFDGSCFTGSARVVGADDSSSQALAGNARGADDSSSLAGNAGGDGSR